MRNPLLISMEDLVPCLHPIWPRVETLGSFGFMARHQVGADGYEFFPVRGRAAEQILTGNIPDNQNYWPGAACQAWRSEQNWAMVRDFWRKHGGWRNSPRLCILVTLAYYRVIERRESMAYLARIREFFSDFLPATIYPPHMPAEGYKHCLIGDTPWCEESYPELPTLLGHGSILVQPESSLKQPDRWGVSTPVNFLQKLDEQGYTGVSINLRALYGTWMDWKSALDVLLPVTQIVRYQPGEYDDEALCYITQKAQWPGPIVVYGTRIPALANRGVFIEVSRRAVVHARQIVN